MVSGVHVSCIPESFSYFLFSDDGGDKSVTIYSANKLKLLALPLDEEIVHILEANTDILKALSKSSMVPLSDRTKSALDELKSNLSKSFQNSSIEQLKATDAVDRLWSIGPKKCGTNILLNTTDFIHKPFWTVVTKNETNERIDVQGRHEVENTFLNGFQLSTLAGPLCDEPMHGICFIVEEWTVNDVDTSGVISGRLTRITC